MVPVCRSEGCQAKVKCTKGCALERDDPPPRIQRLATKPSSAPASPFKAPAKPAAQSPKLVKPLPAPVEKSPKKAPRERCIHVARGPITRKEVPPWKSKPRSPEPWFKTTCGNIVAGDRVGAKEQVTCEVCLRQLAAE